MLGRGRGGVGGDYTEISPLIFCLWAFLDPQMLPWKDRHFNFDFGLVIFEGVGPRDTCAFIPLQRKEFLNKNRNIVMFFQNIVL